MVNEAVKIRDKYRVLKRFIKIFLIVLLVLLILLVSFMAGIMFQKPSPKIVLENPLAGIVLQFTDEAGQLDKTEVINQGVLDFNEEYVNYILVALGVNKLHKSPLTFEYPHIELILGDEVWSSEINKGVPNTSMESIDNEDLRITISKEDAVEALLSSDMEVFMRELASNGDMKIEMIAGKTVLFSKGYLEMYSDLTGETVAI